MVQAWGRYRVGGFGYMRPIIKLQLSPFQTPESNSPRAHPEPEAF